MRHALKDDRAKRRIFFFSSRRRHTRSTRYWSSDVCSSDLALDIVARMAPVTLGFEVDETIYLGNLEAKRDWGHARDYVEGMHKILQADTPDDFVLATGETRSVREFVELSFAEVGRRIEWRGKGVEETGVDKKTGKTLVRIDPVYFRPTEVDLLVGDASKAREKLGWQPKTTLA